MLRQLIKEFTEPDRVDLGRSAAGLGKTQQGRFLKKLFKHGHRLPVTAFIDTVVFIAIRLHSATYRTES